MAETEEMQTIPARHGTATFVPKGSTIKIVNTYGTQVIDTWAFALPTPPKALLEQGKEAEAEDKKEEEGRSEEKEEKAPEKKAAAAPEKKEEAPAPKKPKARKSKNGLDLPTQEEAEAATSQSALQATEEAEKNGTPKKGWSSYLPSLRGGSGGQKALTDGEQQKADDKQQKENSRTWGSYLPSGQGYTSYLPSKGAISAFASSVSGILISYHFHLLRVEKRNNS